MMKKYEYKTITTGTTGFSSGKVDASKMEEVYNSLGDEGWNLVKVISSQQAYGTTLSIISIFKREVI